MIRAETLLFSKKKYIHIDFWLTYLSLSSSAMMTLSLNLGSALLSHQNL